MPNFNVNSQIICRVYIQKRLVAVGKFTWKTGSGELHDLQSHCSSTQMFPFSTWSTLDTWKSRIQTLTKNSLWLQILTPFLQRSRKEIKSKSLWNLPYFQTCFVFNYIENYIIFYGILLFMILTRVRNAIFRIS